MKRRLAIGVLAVGMVLALLVARRVTSTRPTPTPSPGASASIEWVRIPAGDGVAAFEMSKYEVTNAQYRKFVEVNPEWKPGGAKAKQLADSSYLEHWQGGDKEYASTADNAPVAWVSQHAAKAFSEWVGGRLPTHEEWEWAARGGQSGKKYVWGDAWPPPKGAGNFADATAKRKWNNEMVIEDYDDGYAGTAPVGSFAPNGYGLYDMAGNVYEWVAEEGGLRGGSFLNRNPKYLAVSHRYDYNPMYRYITLGFRCARTSR